MTIYREMSESPIPEEDFEAIFKMIPNNRGMIIRSQQDALDYLEHKYTGAYSIYMRDHHLWLVTQSKGDPGAFFFHVERPSPEHFNVMGWAVSTVEWIHPKTVGYMWEPKGARCDLCNIAYEELSLDACYECGTCADCCMDPTHSVMDRE